VVTTASTVKRCGALRPAASSWKAVLSWLFGGGPGGESCCRERNQRKAKIKVMAMKSRTSSASSITDRTEEPNQRLHWFPSWESRVTTCKRWRTGSEDGPRYSLLPPHLLHPAVPRGTGRSLPPCCRRRDWVASNAAGTNACQYRGTSWERVAREDVGSKVCTVKAGDSPLVL